MTEITKTTVNRIDIGIIQDFETGEDDITPFINSLPKLNKIINKPGFKNDFSKEEREFWNNIFESFRQELKNND